MPTSRDVRGSVDPHLSNLSVAFFNAKEGATGQFLFPIFPTDGGKDTGTYFEYDIRNRFQLPETLRAAGDPSNQINWKTTPKTFQTEEHYLHDKLADKTVRIAPSSLNLREDTAEIVMVETRLACTVFPAAKAESKNQFIPVLNCNIYERAVVCCILVFLENQIHPDDFGTSVRNPIY